jgi:carbamoyl-phosphate synthase large subunit
VTTILVTGAGGPAAVCLIKALRKRYRVVATDIDPLAPGLYLAAKGYVGHRPNARGFVAELLRVARRERATIILPTLDEELILLAHNREKFAAAGITLVVADEPALRVATNKRRTYEFFRGEKYCPKLVNPSRPVFPLVVKPVRSRGGRGFYVCESVHELEVALERNQRTLGESVVMEYVPGIEYSVYGVSGRDGKPIVIVPVRRILAISESKEAVIDVNTRIRSVASDIVSKLKLIGPWNIQIMMSKKRVILIEVNPRFAGTVSLVVAAGVNLPDVAIRVFLRRKVKPGKFKIENHLSMTRYNEEMFLPPSAVIKRRA